MKTQALSQAIVKEATKAFLAVVMLSVTVNAGPASAQFTTLRTPLIYGADSAPAFAPPYEGQPPPVGSGFVPPMVTPGDWGSPEAPPTQVYVPPTIGGDKATVNDYVMGALEPPPSTPGADYGNINGSSGGMGLQAPVGTGNINPQGGISFDAPTTRWQAQRSMDYGRNVNVRNQNASRLADFGERLPEKPDLKMMPQFSQDGPRQLYVPEIGQPSRAGNYPDAQATTDLHGNRTNFSQYQSQMTIAPY